MSENKRLYIGGFWRKADNCYRIKMPGRLMCGGERCFLCYDKTVKCIYVYPEEDISDLFRTKAEQVADEATTRLAAMVAKGSFSALDKFGNFQIPCAMREAVGESRMMVIVGAVDHLEIMSDEQFKLITGDTELPDLLVEMKTGGKFKNRLMEKVSALVDAIYSSCGFTEERTGPKRAVSEKIYRLLLAGNIKAIGSFFPELFERAWNNEKHMIALFDFNERLLDLLDETVWLLPVNRQIARSIYDTIQTVGYTRIIVNRLLAEDMRRYFLDTEITKLTAMQNSGQGRGLAER